MVTSVNGVDSLWTLSEMNGKVFMCKVVGHVKCSCKVKLKLSLLISDFNDIAN